MSYLTVGDPDQVARAERMRVVLQAITSLARRMAVELEYVQAVCAEGHSRGTPLCASSEGKALIAEAERLLGPMKDWPEVQEDTRR